MSNDEQTSTLQEQMALLQQQLQQQQQQQDTILQLLQQQQQQQQQYPAHQPQPMQDSGDNSLPTPRAKYEWTPSNELVTLLDMDQDLFVGTPLTDKQRASLIDLYPPIAALDYRPPDAVPAAYGHMNESQRSHDASLKSIQYLLSAVFRPLDLLGHQLLNARETNDIQHSLKILHDARALLLNVITPRPPPNQPLRTGKMPWSQVVARQRTSLIHHTTVVNDSPDSATKTVKSKVWRVGRSPGSVLLDMPSRPESPLQLMALIAEQYPSRIAVATTKEGNRKIAEINFDPEDPSIDQIVADGIFFEKDNLYLCPCKALDTSVRLIRLRLSNLPFLSEAKLLPQLLSSLQPYGSIMDLGLLREPVTGTYMGTGYAILSVPIGNDSFLPLTHHLPWSNALDEGFYAVWNDMPTYCRYCHQEGHAVSECPKKRSNRVCWNCHKTGHIAAECSKDKPSQKARKTPTAPTTREDVAEMPPTTSRPTETKTPAVLVPSIKRKKSVDSLNGDSPRVHSATVLNNATTSVLLSTQDSLFETLFSEPMNSQNTDRMDTTSDTPTAQDTPSATVNNFDASQESASAAQTGPLSGQASRKPQSKYASTDQPGRPSATNTGGTPTASQ